MYFIYSKTARIAGTLRLKKALRVGGEKTEKTYRE